MGHFDNESICCFIIRNEEQYSVVCLKMPIRSLGVNSEDGLFLALFGGRWGGGGGKTFSASL